MSSTKISVFVKVIDPDVSVRKESFLLAEADLTITILGFFIICCHDPDILNEGLIARGVTQTQFDSC